MSIYSRKTLLSAVTLFVMLAILNLGIGFNTFAATESAKKYSGEEIFGGLYFGQGEVAQLFPELWDPYKVTLNDKSKEFAEVKDSMILKIKAKNPDFFNRFGEEMQSGDHIKIQAALSSATEQLREAENSKSINNVDNFYFNDGENVDTDLGTIKAIVIQSVQQQMTFPGPGPQLELITTNVPSQLGRLDSSSLQSDELTDQITIKLDAAS